jgi:nucleoside-diphosphate-sugar epimerase
MRILIIGGTCFIGPWVVKELSAGGHEVAVFHRGQTFASLPADVRSIRGDRQRLADYRADFQAFAPQVVVDMIPFTEADAQDLVKTFAGLAGRMVAIGSMDVYRAYGRLIGTEPGDPDPLPLTETSPLREKLYPYRGPELRPADDPKRWMDDYDKILVERIVLRQPDLPGTVLRLPAVYGPGDRQHRLFSYLKRMDDLRPAILLGEGVANWRWTRGYVEDVAAGIAAAAVQEHAAGQVYNLGEEEAPTESDWIRAIGQATGWTGEVIAIADQELPAHLRFPEDTRQSLAADTTKARRELGYREGADACEALRRTIAWERENPPDPIDLQAFQYASEDAALRQVGKSGYLE